MIMAMMVYMMGKSLAQYNQLSLKEKEEFDKKAIKKIENDMKSQGNGSSNKDEFDAYAKNDPEEVKAAKLKAKQAIVNIDIEKEKRMLKREADKEYLEAIREMH